MTGKEREVADLMERRGVDILCVQETRWKGERARCIGGGYKMWFCGSGNKNNGEREQRYRDGNKSETEMEGEF